MVFKKRFVLLIESKSLRKQILLWSMSLHKEIFTNAGYHRKMIAHVSRIRNFGFSTNCLVKLVDFANSGHREGSESENCLDYLISGWTTILSTGNFLKSCALLPTWGVSHPQSSSMISMMQEQMEYWLASLSWSWCQVVADDFCPPGSNTWTSLTFLFLLQIKRAGPSSGVSLHHSNTFSILHLPLFLLSCSLPQQYSTIS